MKLIKTPFNAEIKLVLSYTSTSQYIFMTARGVIYL